MLADHPTSGEAILGMRWRLTDLPAGAAIVTTDELLQEFAASR